MTFTQALLILIVFSGGLIAWDNWRWYGKNQQREMVESVFNHYYNKVNFNKLTAWQLTVWEFDRSGYIFAAQFARKRLKECRDRHQHVQHLRTASGKQFQRTITKN